MTRAMIPPDAPVEQSSGVAISSISRLLEDHMLLGNRLSIIGLEAATTRPASEVAGIVLDALNAADVRALIIVEPHSAMFESASSGEEPAPA